MQDSLGPLLGSDCRKAELTVAIDRCQCSEPMLARGGAVMAQGAFRLDAREEPRGGSTDAASVVDAGERGRVAVVCKPSEEWR